MREKVLRRRPFLVGEAKAGAWLEGSEKSSSFAAADGCYGLIMGRCTRAVGALSFTGSGGRLSCSAVFSLRAFKYSLTPSPRPPRAGVATNAAVLRFPFFASLMTLAAKNSPGNKGFSKLLSLIMVFS